MNFNYSNVSPIKKDDYRQQNVSPAKYQSQVHQEETDLWKSRCQNLEDNLFQLNSDLEIANFKAKKALELEDKVDMVLKHNAQLLGENDQLSKALQQKRTETDVWKQKYEQQMNSVIGMKASYEMEIKKLSQELIRHKDEANYIRVDGQKILEETVHRQGVESHQQLNNLKKSHEENLEIYEEQVRKLRQTVEDQNYELAQLHGRLREQRTEEDLQVARLAEDREKLLMKMSQIELDTQKEREISKSYVQKQHQDALQNQKQHFRNEINVLESEISKLKNLIDLKNTEIDQLIDQNKKQKYNLEEENETLRIEISELRIQIQENNKQHQDEIDLLRDRVAEQHSNDLNGLRFAHENQIEQLNSEIETMDAIIRTKNHEIEEQIREKENQKDNYNQEVERLNADIEMWRYKHNQVERQKDKEVFEKNRIIEEKENNFNEYSKKCENHIYTLNQEVQALKQLLEHNAFNLEESNRQYRFIREGLEEDLRNAKITIREIEDNALQVSHQKDQQLNQIRSEMFQEIERLQASNKTHEKSNLKLEEEIKRLIETLEIKKEECKNGNSLRLLQEQDIKKLTLEKQQLQEEIIFIERQKNKELEDLHNKLDNNNNFAIQNIQKTYQHQVNMLNGEIQDLYFKLDLKDKELNKYIEKYEKIELIIKDFINNPEKLKDRAEVITIKNLYESLRGTKQKSPSKSPTKRQY